MSTKSIFLSTVLGVILTASGHAAENSVSQESQTLAAQVNVTRDQISQLVAKLKTTPSGAAAFSHPDFIAKSRELNSRIEKAMIEFEATLASDVFRPASLWVDRLKKIETDPAYAPEQRNALFKDQYQQAALAFKSISEKYRATILKLYMSVLPTVELKYRTYELISNNNNSRSCSGEMSQWILHNCYYVKINLDFISKDSRITPATINYWRTVDPSWEFNANTVEEIVKRFQNTVIYNDNVGAAPEVHAAIYEGLVLKGCMSSACTTLFSSQLTSFVSLVSSSLAKTITFKVGTGSLELEPFNFNKQRAIQFLSAPEGLKNDLPFDIQEASYRQALVVQAAAAYANSEVTNCQSEGDRLKELACYSDGGCFNEAEKAYIETAIQNGKSWWGSAKSKKIACLRN